MKKFLSVLMCIQILASSTFANPTNGPQDPEHVKECTDAQAGNAGCAILLGVGLFGIAMQASEKIEATGGKIFAGLMAGLMIFAVFGIKNNAAKNCQQALDDEEDGTPPRNQ